LNKKKTVSLAVVTALIIFLLWLITDVLLNGKLRDIAYSELLDLFSYGWERFRIAIYITAGILIFVFLFIYIQLPEIIIKKKLKKEQNKLTDFVTDCINGNEPDEIPDEYVKIYSAVSKQKIKDISSEYRKNEMISNIAHDLKTPLTSILGYLMLLNDNSSIPEELQKKYTGICLDKAEQLNELISEFFEYTQNTEANITLTKQTLDITELLEQISDELYPLAEKNNRKIDLNYPSALTVSADSSKLARAFENIIKNAVLYSTDEKISVEASGSDEIVKVIVSNKYHHISKEQTERIFERSYRLDNSRTFNGNGGLGLSIAKEIIEAHNGRIYAEYKDKHICIVTELPHGN